MVSFLWPSHLELHTSLPLAFLLGLGLACWGWCLKTFQTHTGRSGEGFCVLQLYTVCSWSCCFDLFGGTLIFYRTILGAGPLLALSVAAEAGHGCCGGLDPSPPTTIASDRLRRRIGGAQNYCHQRPLCIAPQGQHILVGRPDRAFGNNEPMFSFIPHLETAWLPWFTTVASSSPEKLSPGSQPTLASPFSKGLDTKWTSKCKGFSKKCSFHVRSKILPQSMTAPWPLLSILSVPQRERGCATALSRSSNGTTAMLSHSKNCTLQCRTTARAFSTSWFSLSNPTNTHDQVQSAIKVPVTRGTECRTSEDRLPQGSQWPGPWRRPLPSSSTQYHGPKHTAGCVTVENSHRTPGTRWFLHKTLCILHCLLENKLETSSNRTWATR